MKRYGSLAALGAVLLAPPSLGAQQATSLPGLRGAGSRPAGPFEPGRVTEAWALSDPAQAPGSPAVGDPRRKELEQRVRRDLDSLHEASRQDLDSRREVSQGLLLDGSLDREAWRRRILARIDRRIDEAVERLRVEVRAIVEEELSLSRGEGTFFDGLEFKGRVIHVSPEELLEAAQPWMGVELAAQEGAESLRVKAVLPVGPAATAGLREGDRILSVLGVPVADRAELGAVLATRMPGDRVEVKVRRGEEEVVLFLVLGLPPEGRSAAVDEDDEEARLAADRAESAGAPEARLGDDPEAIKIGFEETGSGKPPKGWSFARTGEGPEGKWTVESDGENSVLKQSSADPTISRYPVAVLDGKSFGDFTLTARFRPISGEVDQAGGVVFRYVDANRYLICRANSLEENFRLYTVIDGKRQQLKSQDVKVLAKEWHTIKVECRGKEVKCSLDGGTPLVAEIEGFAPGKVGFWTKADSVTLFDDLEVEPILK